MHILVTNDDGPPSTQSSPYILSLVRTLQSRGHIVSVVLPHTQRSWISKAHIIGQNIKPTYYRPHPTPAPITSQSSSNPPPGESGQKPAEHYHYYHNDLGVTSTRPLPADSTDEEWVLVDSTPASCVQIGLYHLFPNRPPIDLVVSGPNYGRNATAVFALSSGTLGGALEAAVCGVKAVALSYAFFDRNHDPDIIGEATRISVRVIEKLAQEWRTGPDAPELFSVNVPLQKGVEKAKVLYTYMLRNYWKQASCFKMEEVPEEEDFGPEEREEQIRKAEETAGQSNGEDSGGHEHVRYTHKHFKWAPRFKDVYDSVKQSKPGNDGWAVEEGHVSVTPLRACYMHAEGFDGEMKL